MTTLAELVAQTPAPTRGVLTDIDYGSGVWRFVLELADPSAGAAVQWYDLTGILDPRVWTGYEYTRGADAYQGRFRASVVTLDLYADDDSLAPWNDDTSPTFGTHVALGPGLMIRGGFIRVDAGVVADWNPRFTNKVESWRDASHSRGKVRQHRIVARDLLSSLVGVPLPARPEENWSERMYHFLVDSGWPYGATIYGAQYEADTTTPIKLLAARPASSSAINELDAALDPVGLVWYTDRIGQLVVRPRVDDTFHRDAFLAGATGDEWPGDATPVDFTWWACEGDVPGETPSDSAAYATDTPGVEPFGLDKTESAVINHVKIQTPASGSIAASLFDDDDPLSVQRFDRKSMQATWMAANDVVAAQILASRAWSQVEARPLHAALGMEGFHPGPASIDYLGYVAVQHRNNDEGLSVYANGWLRSYRELVRPRGCDIDWSLTMTIDVYATTSEASLLPVYNLHLVGIVDTAAEFGWNNPEQTIEPTHTQIRLQNPTSAWVLTDYPGPVADAGVWTGLSPDTAYTFQVRLVRIVDGLITHFSATRSITVRTDTTTVPTPPDPGGGGGTLPTPDCDGIAVVEWELQTSVDLITWTDVSGTVDSEGTDYEAPWVFPFNPALHPDDVWYRHRSRTICSGIPGPWVYGAPFANGCNPVARLGVPPYNDADLVAYWPQICPPDKVHEAISDELASHGNAWGGIAADAAGVPVLTSDAQGVVVTGTQPAAIAGSSDLTIACRVRLGELPSAEVAVFYYGASWISVTSSGAVKGHVYESGAGETSISGPTDLAPGVVYDLALTHDVGADTLRLYIDAVQEASAIGSVGARSSFSGFSMRLPDDSWITDCAVWDRVLAAEELPGAAPMGVTINQGATQADPTSDLIVYFDVEFAYPVTGFLSGDVVLSGSSGATTVTLTPLGDDMHWTVAVSGMNTTGLLIADISAGAATSIATGLPTPHSTSTDHIISWVNPIPVDLPVFVSVNSGIGTTNNAKSATINEASIPRTRVLAVVCVTRASSAAGACGLGTVDGYNIGNATGLDGLGTSGGTALLGANFGTRSLICMRQDWLSFVSNAYAGDEYVAQSGAADINMSAAYYRVPYPWKVRQHASAATATTALSVTLASPVAASSRLVLCVAMLEANSVTSGPVGFTLDGTSGLVGNRTSRITAYRSQGVDHVGETTFTATVASITGGAAITVIELEQGDSIVTNLPSAIRASPGLLAYYPMSHTLGNIEKNWDGSLGVYNLTSFNNFANIYAVAGPDGRSYAQHVVGANPAAIVNHAEFTPNGAGGLTVGFVVRVDSLAALQALVSKNTSAANFAKEWEIYVDTDGSLVARTCQGSSVPPASARERRTAAGTIPVGTWKFVIVRFGNGVNDFPTIRVNGVNQAGTTSGAAAANAASAANPVVGAAYVSSASRAMAAAMGHLFFNTTNLSDADCATIEAGADADGWY